MRKRKHYLLIHNILFFMPTYPMAIGLYKFLAKIFERFLDRSPKEIKTLKSIKLCE